MKSRRSHALPFALDWVLLIAAPRARAAQCKAQSGSRTWSR